MRESYTTLREFILSDKFLKDYDEFEKLIGDFQAKLVTLVEVLQTPSPEARQLTPQTALQTQTVSQPTQQAQEEIIREQAESISWGKLAVTAIVLLLVGAAVYQGYVPVETLQWITVGTVLIIFLPGILRTVYGILRERGKPEEEKALGVKLEEWIHARLKWIRERHFKAWTAIRSEIQTPDILSEYEILGIDPVVYDRREYFKKRLSFEFLNITGEILSACNSNIWTRKNIVIASIVAAQAPLGGRTHGS